MNSYTYMDESKNFDNGGQKVHIVIFINVIITIFFYTKLYFF